MAVQIMQQPYNPAPATGWGNAVGAFTPFLDLLTKSLLQGQISSAMQGAGGMGGMGSLLGGMGGMGGNAGEGQQQVTAPNGQMYFGNGFSGAVPTGFTQTPAVRPPSFRRHFMAALGENLNPGFADRVTAQQLNQYKLQAAPYELQKLQADIANQQALGGYYRAAGQSMSGQTTPVESPTTLQYLSQRALAGDEEAVAALRELGAL